MARIFINNDTAQPARTSVRYFGIYGEMGFIRQYLMNFNSAYKNGGAALTIKKISISIPRDVPLYL